MLLCEDRTDGDCDREFDGVMSLERPRPGERERELYGVAGGEG